MPPSSSSACRTAARSRACSRVASASASASASAPEPPSGGSSSPASARACTSQPSTQRSATTAGSGNPAVRSSRTAPRSRTARSRATGPRARRVGEPGPPALGCLDRVGLWVARRLGARATSPLLAPAGSASLNLSQSSLAADRIRGSAADTSTKDRTRTSPQPPPELSGLSGTGPLPRAVRTACAIACAGARARRGACGSVGRARPSCGGGCGPGRGPDARRPAPRA